MILSFDLDPWSLICKGTFGSGNIEYKKTFVETLGSFVNVFGCDCYASCLTFQWILHANKYFYVVIVLIFCRVANWLEEIAKASYIVFRSNSFIFREFFNCHFLHWISFYRCRTVITNLVVACVKWIQDGWQRGKQLRRWNQDYLDSQMDGCHTNQGSLHFMLSKSKTTTGET